MGKKWNRCMRGIAFLLIFSLLSGYLPQKEAKADSAYIFTVILKNETIETNDSEEALTKAYYSDGATININRDCVFPSGATNTIGNNTTLNIPSGVNVTLANKKFAIQNGTLNVYGFLDVSAYEKSEIFTIENGRINVAGSGYIKKKAIEAQKIEVTGKNIHTISYGEYPPLDCVNPEAVGYTTDVTGNWKYTDESRKKIWPAGLHSVPVVFEPSSPDTYGSFPIAGTTALLRVNKANLTQKDSPVEIKKFGEDVTDIHQTCTMVSSVTGEVVPGEIIYDRSSVSQGKIGTHAVMGEFTPKDSNNFNKAKCFVTVKVEPARPEIKKIPSIGARVYHGDSLKNIPLDGGECVNPYTKEKVEGTFAWKNPNENAEYGQHDYTVVFCPDTKEHETIEFSVSITALPKKMDTITWPECGSITYGQSLRDSQLSIKENEYGSFLWVDEDEKPTVNNEGVSVRFVPKDSSCYDWSGLEGYDAKTGSIILKRPITVKPISGEVPEVTTDAVKAGEKLSSVKLHINGIDGKIEWEDLNQIVTKSGTYIALYSPNDVINYDWSIFKPNSAGKIKIPVEIIVTANSGGSTGSGSTGENNSGSGSSTGSGSNPSFTEKPGATSGTTPTKEPGTTTGTTPTKEPGTTSGTTPTKEPGATSGTTPTKEPGTTSGTTPTKEPGTTTGTTPTIAPGVTQAPESTQKPSNKKEEGPFVIKQISTISKIKIPGAASIGKVKVKTISIKRAGKVVKIKVKKAKGVRYQIRYSTTKNMKKAKMIKMKKTSATIRNLKKNKKYYFQVRLWKKKKNKNIYGKWSVKRKI